MSEHLFSRVIPVLILVLALGVNAASLPGDFFNDDQVIVQGNPLVAHPDLHTIFTSDYWGPSESTGLYRPLTILSFAMNRAVSDAGAGGFHRVNLMLHAVVSLLLYALLRRIDWGAWASGLAAALFAVHPIHGEAIHTLVGRAELLVALFVLLGLWISRREGRWRGMAVAGCFCGALLSKEHGIAMLALLPAVDLYYERRVRVLLGRRWALYVMLVALAAAWLVFRHTGVVRPELPAEYVDPIYVPLSVLGWGARTVAALHVQVLYLAKLFVPVGLQGAYPPATVLPVPGFGTLRGAITAVTPVALLVIAWWRWKKRCVLGLAIALYVVSFAPSSNLLVLTRVTMAERLAYLPSAWFCATLAVLVVRLVQKLPDTRGQLVVIAGVVCLYGAAGIDRSLDFRSAEILWRNDLQRNPGNELSSLFLADDLWRHGKREDAEQVYRNLLRISPYFSEGLKVYAERLVDMKRPEEAIRIARESIKASRSISTDYITLADAYRVRGDYDEALRTLEIYRQSSGHGSYLWEVYGKTLEEMGEVSGAMECYRRELIGGKPHANDTLMRIARLHLRLGQPREAEEILRRELLTEDLAPAWNMLGIALSMQERGGEAAAAFARAVALEPGDADFQHNLQLRQAGVRTREIAYTKR